MVDPQLGYQPRATEYAVASLAEWTYFDGGRTRR
jgi:hypothetical protein